MVRRCERPGCGEPAELGYGIDAERLTVWIEPLAPAGDDRPGVLCRRHADSMVVPLRWTLDDRRDAVPRLFRAPATDEPVARTAPRRVRRRSPGGEQLALDGDCDEVTPAAPDTSADDAARETGAAPVDESPAMPWRPVFDPEDDLDGLLDTSSPLLSRAFHGRIRDQPAR